MTDKTDGCSKCGFPIDKRESGVREYGTHRAHPERRCHELQQAELTRLRAEVARLEAEKQCLGIAHAEAVKDAERYRYVRAKHWFREALERIFGGPTPSAIDADTFIDDRIETGTVLGKYVSDTAMRGDREDG